MATDSRAARRPVLAISLIAVAALITGTAVSGQKPADRAADRAAERAAAARAAAEERAAQKWVTDTLKKMTLEEKVGQLLAPSINAAVTPVDSDAFETAMHLVKDLHVGSIHVFGSTEATPAVMLNPAYSGASASRKGDPYAAAALLNRLQQAAAIPLLTTADFEGGVGYILNGGTRVPRAMAISASRDPQLAFRAGQLTASEGRSIGILADFYPVVDVNNNPRNPIINIRSFGENVDLVSEMAAAYIKGIHAGGMLASAKHFPGHGDTSVDTHLGLPTIEHPRSHLDQIELPPYKAAIAAGVDIVMSTHIILPALDPTPGIPATLSRLILTGLLRDELKFEGLVYTDSMSMNAISNQFPPDKAAAMAIRAGADFVLHSPDNDLAFKGIMDAVRAGEISMEQLDASVERILKVKAKLGLHRLRMTDLGAIADRLGGRANERTAFEIAERAVTLLKDERNQVPLTLPRDTNVLYLSVVDYASGWREGAPARAIIPALKQRWPNLTAIEVTDRTTAPEIDLIKALARRSSAVIAGVYVRIASYSGRMDLEPNQVELLDWLSGQPVPFVAAVFGNPYAVGVMGKAPAILLGYEFGDAAEVAMARAIEGEAAISGKLPITLPGQFEYGHGLIRSGKMGAKRP
jgi:beta-N-acetylhexosaminidase